MASSRPCLSRPDASASPVPADGGVGVPPPGSWSRPPPMLSKKFDLWPPLKGCPAAGSLNRVRTTVIAAVRERIFRPWRWRGTSVRSFGGLVPKRRVSVGPSGRVCPAPRWSSPSCYRERCPSWPRRRFSTAELRTLQSENERQRRTRDPPAVVVRTLQ